MTDCATFNCTTQTFLYFLNTSGCVNHDVLNQITDLLTPANLQTNTSASNHIVEAKPAVKTVTDCKCKIKMVPPWECTELSYVHHEDTVRAPRINIHAEGCSKGSFLKANKVCQENGFFYGLCQPGQYIGGVLAYCSDVICIARSEGHQLTYANNSASKLVENCDCGAGIFFADSMFSASAEYIAKEVVADPTVDEEYKKFLQSKLNAEVIYLEKINTEFRRLLKESARKKTTPIPYQQKVAQNAANQYNYYSTGWG